MACGEDAGALVLDLSFSCRSSVIEASDPPANGGVAVASWGR